MDYSFLKEYYSYFVSGSVITLMISIITIFFGTFFGILLALMKRSSLAPLKWVASTYIAIFRGTPMLVQILIANGLFHQVVTLPPITIGVLQIDFSRLFPGILALSMNSAAYVAEIVRAGINAVSSGQFEAARSLGMNGSQTMRFIVFPQALRNILPALGNEFIVLIKDSSLLSTLGIYELMNSAQIVITSSFIPLKPLYVAAIIYFFMTFVTSQLLKLWENKLGKGFVKIR